MALLLGVEQSLARLGLMRVVNENVAGAVLCSAGQSESIKRPPRVHPPHPGQWLKFLYLHFRSEHRHCFRSGPKDLRLASTRLLKRFFDDFREPLSPRLREASVHAADFAEADAHNVRGSNTGIE